MGLENLLDGGIHSIHALQETERQPESNVLKRFKGLRETALYDREREQWNEYLWEDQSLASTERRSLNQLLDVFIEGLFDKRKAHARYQKLKQSPFFDKQSTHWLIALDEDQGVAYTIRHTADQLMGVFVEACFNKEYAQVSYEKLKRQPFYDAQMEQWLISYNEDNTVRNTNRDTGDQLLGILVEGLFDRDKAKKLYDTLKKTPLFDEESQLWFSYMPADQEMRVYRHNAHDQLLSVLVEGMFDKNKAKEMYVQLKQTEFYDTTYKQWMEPTVRDESQRFATDQMLGIWVEKMLEEGDLVAKEELVPVVRQF